MHIDELDLYWLAGLLEGEGSFCAGTPKVPNKPYVGMNSVDEDVIARVASLLRIKYQYCAPKRYEAMGWKPFYSIRLVGARAVDLMHAVRPLMGTRRQAQIDHALACYKGDERYVLQGEKLEALKQRLQAGEHVLSLAKEFGVSKSYAYLLKSRLVSCADVV
ncbi:MAG: hypothetical protein SF162_12535 [bacterium]|nr:hypothetical protein [bacterium]